MRTIAIALLALASCAPPVVCPESPGPEPVAIITYGEWGRCGAVATGPTRLETPRHCLGGYDRGGVYLRGESVMTRSWRLESCRESRWEPVCTLTADRPLPAWAEWDEPVECTGAVVVHHHDSDWSRLTDVDATSAGGDGYRLSIRLGKGASGGGVFCGGKLHSLIQGMYGDGQITTQR